MTPLELYDTIVDDMYTYDTVYTVHVFFTRVHGAPENWQVLTAKYTATAGRQSIINVIIVIVQNGKYIRGNIVQVRQDNVSDNDRLDLHYAARNKLHQETSRPRRSPGMTEYISIFIMTQKASKPGHNDLDFLLCDQSSSVGLCVQD